jgi:hypothetical protein
MRAFLAALVVVLLAVLVSSEEQAFAGFDGMPFPTNLLPFNSRLTEDMLCYVVGVISGCSGCELGTKGLCAWIEVPFNLYGTNPPAKRSVSQPPSALAIGQGYDPSSVTYECLLRDTADFYINLVEARGFANASHLCPVDPIREPIINAPLRVIEAHIGSVLVKKREASELSEVLKEQLDLDSESRLGNTVPTTLPVVRGTLTTLVREKTSLLHSSWHREFHSTLPKSTLWAVDRSSLWGSAGFAYTSGWGQVFREAGRLPTIDCAYINSPRVLLDLRSIFVGFRVNANSEWCRRLYFSAYLSTRCPAYGQAISGICHSFYEALDVNCNRPSNADYPMFYNFHTEAGIPPQPAPLFGYPIVADDTPYCLDAVPLYTDGELDHFAGLFEDFETIPLPE